MSTVPAVRERSAAARSATNSAVVSARESQLSGELEAARLAIRRLQIEAARLRDDLVRSQSASPQPFLGEAGLPLFTPDLLTARVLEAPARDDIERTVLTLNEGSTARVALAEWVLGDDGVTIDQGQDGHVPADAPVLAGRRVFGRIGSTGRFTSRVQHVSDPAFRSHAKLVRRAGDRTIAGADGLLAGTGDGHCRLDLIPATEPVEVGDLVVTATTIPGIDEALYLGEVRRAELVPGAAHWAITVAPAVAIHEARQLEVVRVGLHPGRQPAAPTDGDTAHTASASREVQR